MELVLAFLVLVALLALLNWAALNWGYNSRRLHVSDSFADRRTDW